MTRSKNSPIDSTPKSLASPVSIDSKLSIEEVTLSHIEKGTVELKAKDNNLFHETNVSKEAIVNFENKDPVLANINKETEVDNDSKEMKVEVTTESVKTECLNNVTNTEHIKQITTELIKVESTPQLLVPADEPPQDQKENEMTTSMTKIRINTEEEAKAALAERRRLAREEAERQAEQERLRVQREAQEEFERQRREEEQVQRLVEQQRMAEQERLEEVGYC